MKTFAILTLALCMTVCAGSATATQLFDFDGQAKLPTTAGSAAEVYGVIVNGNAVATPIPLDFANYQYTVVVTDLILDATGPTSFFVDGNVAIYQDAGTPADWADPATFTDGEAILSGTMAAFQHTMLTSTLGNGQGTVDWTGGTRLNDLAPSDQSDWPFLTLISRSATQVEDGFDEKWDGKIEPREVVVGSESRSWSGLKAAFR